MYAANYITGAADPDPSLSPIIVQPVQGLNGMPPRANFQLYNSDKWWIGWSKAEASDLGINAN